MDYRKLIINAVLAGLWAGLAVLLASDQPLTKAAVVAALTVALRAAIGYLSDKAGRTVPVDA